MRTDRRVIGALAVMTAAVLWGFDGVVLTPRLYNLDVGFVVFMLHLIPFILMNTFLFREYARLRDFSGPDLFNLFLIAFFGGALGTLAIVKALFLVNFEHLSVVVLLQKLQPVFAIILAAIILKEKIRKDFIFWALIAIAASYFLTFGLSSPRLSGDNKMFQAALWALLAAFSFGSSTVFSKKALLKFSFYTTNFYRFGFTMTIMLIYVVITGKLNWFSQVTTTNWIFFIIIAVTTGSGAIFLYYYGLNRVKAIVSTICELFFPLSAIIFDYIINKQALTTIQWVSASVLMVAILRISIYKKLAR